MASVKTVVAAPATIQSGETSTITYALDNQAHAITVTLTDETGSAASAVLTIGAEPITLSTDPAKIGADGRAAPGYIVAIASPSNLGTLSVLGSGAFTYVAK